MVETIGAIIIAAAEAAGAAGIPATILGVSTASIVGTAAVIGVSIGLQYALRPSLPKPADGTQPIKQAVPPRIRGYGRNRLAGYYMYFEEAAGNSCDVMAFHSGRIGGVVAHYLHDDLVTLIPDTYGVLPGDDGRYGGHNVGIQTTLGTDTPPLAQFIGLPGIGATWTAEHAGKGIAWASLVCSGVKEKDFQKIYPRGLPVLSVVADCSVVWDPRDLTQIRSDESTWKTSFNPVIQLMDYLTRADGGLGLDYDTVIAPVLGAWLHEADLCDEFVEKADGSFEPRYQCSIWFQFDNKPEDVINGILSTCDGWLSENGDGTFSIVVGFYREPDVTLNEKHILAFSVSYGQPDEQSVNQLDITFTDPEQNYSSVQTETWRDEDAISLAGVVRSQPIDLSWVQSNSQARRLASRAMQRLNPAMTGSITTTLYGLRAIGRRWVRLQYPFVSGLQDCVIEIQSADLDLMAGRVTFNFNLIGDDIEAYDPIEDEGRAPVIPPSIGSDALPVPTSVNSTLTGNDTDGYRLLVTFDDPGRSDVSYLVRYRIADAGDGNPGPWVEASGDDTNSDGTTVSITTGLVQLGSAYIVQAATVGPRGSISSWSLLPFKADSNLYTADSTLITADHS
jgi:hypothetical protein